MPDVCVLYGEELGRYGFEPSHPFSKKRLAAFWKEFTARGLKDKVAIEEPERADETALRLFHDPAYIRFVKEVTEVGEGFLDNGDTPAQKGIFEAASFVAGSSLKAARLVVEDKYKRAFCPIGGLHHAGRNRASGFCVFNDVGIVIEYLRRIYGAQRVAYVDIDAHHGDGVFYGFESDPGVFIADIHEDGRYLFPGTGSRDETGRGAALGTKLNLPLPPGAGPSAFLSAFEKVELFLDECRPEFILFQCGADSLAGDPLAQLRFTPDCHRFAAERLKVLADRWARGRILAFGGGGYNFSNIGRAWCAVIEAFSESTQLREIA